VTLSAWFGEFAPDALLSWRTMTTQAVAGVTPSRLYLLRITVAYDL
jgi:hypothetical protein